MLKKNLPKFNEPTFICPYCQVQSGHIWQELAYKDKATAAPKITVHTSTCVVCLQSALWKDEKLVFPLTNSIPQPYEYMPHHIVKIYKEAANVFTFSPSSSAALLRLALEMLVKHLGYDEKNLNAAIKAIVKDGIPKVVQQSLDIVRIYGNHSVHPGEIKLDESPDSALGLFFLLNLITQYMIAAPAQVEELYNQLPQKDLDSIAKRDKQSTNS